MSPVRQIETLLRETMGLDAETLGSNAVERAVRSRMTALAQPQGDLLTYWQMLQQSPQELQALIEAVVVPETWFFRHRDAFTAMIEMARELHARRSDGPRHAQSIRLLSLPCATGEEPYSMAMAMLDAGFAADSFTVDAMDISERALSVARAGVYGRNSFRGPADSFDFRDRHFTSTGDSWQVGDAVRAQVRWHAGNLFDASLSDRLGTFDFVFFRNVLIYFDREGQRRAIAALERLMRLGATLFAGPAEGGALTSAGLTSTGHTQAFSFRMAGPVRDLAMPTPLAGTIAAAQATLQGLPGARKSFAVPTAGAAATTVSGAIQRRAFATHGAGGTTTQDAWRTSSAPAVASASTGGVTAAATAASSRLTDAAALADAGDLARAEALCRDVLAQERSNAQAEYLLGLVADARGSADGALDHYRRALYLQPDHYEALVHCAALLEARGDAAGASRLRSRAERAAPSHSKEAERR